MSSQPDTTDSAFAALLERDISALARAASVELNLHDLRHLDAGRALLSPGTRVYISHLPKQSWQDTAAACRQVHAAGLQPVPHVPIRLIGDAAMLDRIIGQLVEARAQELLLISGDYGQPAGPYSAVAQVLSSGVLERRGVQRVSVAGHPEGHPRVGLDEIRRAERDKALLAAQAGLPLTFVTQFFFESAPFLDWVAQLRSEGIRARIIAGVAGPAGLATLFKFALRCGVGPSIRALGARPGSVARLMGDRGPEALVRRLADARASADLEFDGLHLFSFGGYLRTCQWLHAVGSGRLRLDERGGFEIR